MLRFGPSTVWVPSPCTPKNLKQDWLKAQLIRRDRKGWYAAGSSNALHRHTGLLLLQDFRKKSKFIFSYLPLWSELLARRSSTTICITKINRKLPLILIGFGTTYFKHYWICFDSDRNLTVDRRDGKVRKREPVPNIPTNCQNWFRYETPLHRAEVKRQLLIASADRRAWGTAALTQQVCGWQEAFQGHPKLLVLGRNSEKN